MLQRKEEDLFKGAQLCLETFIGTPAVFAEDNNALLEDIVRVACFHPPSFIGTSGYEGIPRRCELQSAFYFNGHQNKISLISKYSEYLQIFELMIFCY